MLIIGEIGVILVNLSNQAFEIQNGERIAQLIIAKHDRADWVEVQRYLKPLER
jgi:dUTP pyrophosphatase